LDSDEFCEGKDGISPSSWLAMAQRATALSWSSAATSGLARNPSTKTMARSRARTMAAAARSSLDAKCLYKLALAMPASAATSSTVMAS
jgi:hypothetical protein